MSPVMQTTIAVRATVSPTAAASSRGRLGIYQESGASVLERVHSALQDAAFERDRVLGHYPMTMAGTMLLRRIRSTVDTVLMGSIVRRTSYHMLAADA